MIMTNTKNCTKRKNKKIYKSYRKKSYNVSRGFKGGKKRIWWGEFRNGYSKRKIFDINSEG